MMIGLDHALAGQVAVRLFPALMVVAAAADVMWLRIPNWLILLLVISFLPFAATTGMPLWLFATNLTTASVLLVAGYLIFSRGWFGGGDAKLLAAAGLWLGFPCVLPFILLTAAVGGVLAAAIGLMFALHVEAGFRSARLDRVFAVFKPDVPYGFAIAAGAILTTPLSWWMVSATG